MARQARGRTCRAAWGQCPPPLPAPHSAQMRQSSRRRCAWLSPAALVTGLQPVEKVLVDGDRVARGVRLVGGKEISARYVLSNATHHTTFTSLVPQAGGSQTWRRCSWRQDVLSDTFKKEVAGIDYRSPVTKINGERDGIERCASCWRSGRERATQLHGAAQHGGQARAAAPRGTCLRMVVPG